jgi:S-formylglutathione hydrolase FrmB
MTLNWQVYCKSKLDHLKDLKTPPMQKKALLLLLFCLWGNIAFSQQLGKVIESRLVKSQVLNRDVAYAVYLPADYSTSERAYPVVYLLHGLSGDNTQWIQWGEINRYADKAIADGTIPPMIIISSCPTVVGAGT